ncbi:uncharacterized protein DSM5745_01439 [Aspergillus mulundensis]|uniref:Putative GPI-anchored protein n=1 Tax=Aspergillus mulundensis TaxID=1810919 RepID=A0A3D8T6C6_9EURO|nr:putative GPI-anchored protein [Aspergillus mulundensis]RDW94117.1 putative GPI-anchored protein [Aspergillus mulundensis]
MKLSGWIAIAFFGAGALSTSPSHIPFDHPITASPETNRRAYDILQLLNKRDGNCPGGYSPCDNLDNSGICCRTDAICTSDDANHIACCPSGASCTGTLGGGSTSGSGGWQTTSDATTTTDDDPTSTITGSTMNGGYPFVYVPTSFSDADECSSYYDRCQSSYTACVTYFGGYGVTVTGGGADFTQTGGAASAVETCSSLSQSACRGLNLGVCGNYEGGTDGAGYRRTSSLQDIVVGMVVGVAGFFI